MSAYTLRSKIEESRRWYMEKYKRLGWQWTDEGLPYAIMDYHSCVGSVLDFTDDDWQVAEENGFSRDEVIITLCEDREDE